MDVESMLEIFLKCVRTVVSKCYLISQTIISEVYRIYDANKKCVIGAPTAVCESESGSLFITIINGKLHHAILHYPVDVCEIESELAGPMRLSYDKEVLYVSKSGKGTIRVIDTSGKKIRPVGIA